MFFHFRRMLVPWSVIFFPTHIISQYMTLVMSGIFTIILIGFGKPFQSKWRNFFEAAEEYSIIFLMYHMFCFTDWLPDPELQHNIGYSLVTCIGLQLFVPLSIMFVMYLKGCIRTQRRKKYLRSAR